MLCLPHINFEEADALRCVQCRRKPFSKQYEFRIYVQRAPNASQLHTYAILTSINAILMSINATLTLGSVLGFMIFFFVIFGIVGMGIFQGSVTLTAFQTTI